jgi:hypothetical protein
MKLKNDVPTKTYEEINRVVELNSLDHFKQFMNLLKSTFMNDLIMTKLKGNIDENVV